MLEKNNNRSSYKEPNTGIKAFFGGILLLAGLAVAAGIVFILYSLLMNQESLVLLQQFDIKQQAEQLLTETVGTVPDLPAGLFRIVGFILVIILLILALRITRLLIETGASLLHSDLRIVAKRLREELINLRDGY